MVSVPRSKALITITCEVQYLKPASQCGEKGKNDAKSQRNIMGWKARIGSRTGVTLGKLLLPHQPYFRCPLHAASAFKRKWKLPIEQDRCLTDRLSQQRVSKPRRRLSLHLNPAHLHIAEHLQARKAGNHGLRELPGQSHARNVPPRYMICDETSLCQTGTHPRLDGGNFRHLSPSKAARKGKAPCTKVENLST